MDFADKFQRKVCDTLAASRRADDEALQVRVVLLACQSVAEIEVRHAAARGSNQREQQHVPFGITLRKRHNGLNHCRQVLRLYMFRDVQILIRFHRRL